MRRKRDQAYALAVMVSTNVNWRNYRRVRNKFQDMLRTKKHNYIERKLHNARGDSKETWKILKALLNRNQEIREVEINGVSVQDK